MEILTERIRTVLRVYQNRKALFNHENTDLKNLKKGNLELDDLKQLCYWKNEIVELTVAEFNLIKSLAKYPGVVKDRNQLMDTMYGDSIYVDDRTIDSHIKRLRRKFKNLDKNFERANDEDWSTEYLDKIISVKIVDGTITKTDLAFNPEDDAVALSIALG